MMRAYRIRVFGEPRRSIDADQLARALLMLARELQARQRAEEAAQGEGSPPERGGPRDA